MRQQAGAGQIAYFKLLNQVMLPIMQRVKRQKVQRAMRHNHQPFGLP